MAISVVLVVQFNVKIISFVKEKSNKPYKEMVAVSFHAAKA